MKEPIIETPSGKDEAYENFPVGSWLLPSAIRPHVAAFYAFARAIDDIADSPSLDSSEKWNRLDRFEQVLTGAVDAQAGLEKAECMRASMLETGVAVQHGVDLIAAFKQDCTKTRYADWDDLLGYCMLSAAPVGRYLLDLHGGSVHGYGPSDALCMALQVINHLQDCQDDYRTLDRVYLPQDWMAEEGVNVEALDDTHTSPTLRHVIDRAIASTRTLMVEAHRLPKGLKSRRLAMESDAIIRIAEALLNKLAAGDPLASRIVLPKWRYVACCALGMVSGLKR